MSLQEVRQGQAQNLKKQPIKKTGFLPNIFTPPQQRRVYVSPNAPQAVQQYMQEQKTPPVTQTQPEMQRSIRKQTVEQRFNSLQAAVNTLHSNPNSPFRQQQNLNVARSQIRNTLPGGRKYDANLQYTYTLGGKPSNANEVLNYIEAQKTNETNRERYYTKQRIGAKNQIGRLSSYSQEVNNYPPGTTFTTHAGKTTVNIPESAQLEQNRYYIKEANKKGGLLGEINRFTQGVTSDILFIGAPIADITGLRKQYDAIGNELMARSNSFVFPVLALPELLDYKNKEKLAQGGAKAGRYGVHYVNTLDVAFEPIGWSPKGSTKVLKEGGLAFQAGGITGEVSQWVTFSAALKPISKGARILTSKVIRSETIGKLIEFPAFKKIDITLGKKLSESTVIKNLGLYRKGYTPVNMGFEVTKGAPQTTKNVFEQFTRTSYKQSYKYGTKTRYGFAERKFIEPGKAGNLLKPELNITGVSRGGQISIIGEKTSYNKSFLGKIEKQYYDIKLFTNTPKVTNKSIGLTAKLEHGSLERAAPKYSYGLMRESEVMPLSEVSKLSPVRGMSRNPMWYDIAKRENIPFKALRTDKKVVLKEFLKENKAYQSLVSVPRSIYGKTSGLTARGETEGARSVFLPVNKGAQKVIPFSLYFTGQTTRRTLDYKSDLYFKTDQRQDFDYKMKQMQGLDTRSLLKIGIKQGQMQDTSLQYKQAFKQMQRTEYKQATVQKTEQKYTPTNVILPPIIPFGGKLFGGGVRGYGFSVSNPLEYKFRKANIKLPFSDIKTPRFKL